MHFVFLLSFKKLIYLVAVTHSNIILDAVVYIFAVLFCFCAFNINFVEDTKLCI